jgi:WD40 repeat protein
VTLEGAGGTSLELRGDEVLAVFVSARQAIRAAIDLQEALVAATISDPSLPLPVGIGLDAGEAVEVEGGFRGGALNLAARLCALAGPGEILASQEVVHLARRVEGVVRVDRGPVRLKGLAEPVRVSRLSREGWDPGEDVLFQRALGPRVSRATITGAPVCPYRGLAAFQPEDADRFFGREELVAELLDRLDRDRVLFVVGPSGSGKSSVVRAGLIPAVRAGGVADSARWPVALFSPRAEPTAELSYQLRRIADAAAPPGGGSGEPSSVLRPVEARRLADSICASSGGLLMVIDQFEELFTLNRRPDQEAFIEMLAALVDPAGSRVRAVMAMRADFYGICATFPWLAKRVAANQVLVGPMSRADLRKTIEQPAAVAGLRLEDGLVDTVLEDGGSEPAALPLVSHAMAETWRRRDEDTLTLAGYREAGGVAGSISQTADSLYEMAFDEAEREVCRRLMLRLVTPGEGTSDTRRRLFTSELDRDPDPEMSRKVAADLIDARLLTVDRDSLEIAHEALLQSWPRLRAWIEEGRDDLRTRRRIDHAAAEWSAQDRDPDLLYRGAPLQAALEWVADHGDVLGPTEEGFLAESEQASLRSRAQAEEAARRSLRLRRVAVSILAILTIAAVVASIVAFSALGQARSRYGQALAAQAVGFTDSDPRAAIALAVEAMARGQERSIDARSALVDASQALADATFLPSGPAVSVGDSSSIAVSPDGEFIVTGNRDGSISTWKPTGDVLDANVAGHAKAIEEMDFAPDGRWLVSGSDDGSIHLWDLADPTDVPPPATVGETGSIVWNVAVAPDGAMAASATEDGAIRLWDLMARRQIGEPIAQLNGDALTVAFSPDGELILAGNGVGGVIGWSVADRRVAIPWFSAHRSDVWEIEFDPAGSRFATASSDGRIRLWDTTTGELVAEPFARTADDVRGVMMVDAENVVAGDEDGHLLVAPANGSAGPTVTASRHDAQIVDAAWGTGTLATLGADQQMQVWSSAGDPTALEIAEQTSGAYAVAASPDGTRIATGDGQGNVRVFSASTGERQLGPVRLHEGIVWGLAFSEDGSMLASGGEDGHVQVIDAFTGGALTSPDPAGEQIDAVLFADGRLLAGGADGTIRIWSGAALEGELGPHRGGVTAMALSPHGVLAVADRSGLVRIWSLDDQSQVGQALAADDNTIWGLAWSADGAVLATASADEAVQLWEVSTRELIGSLSPHPGGATGVGFLGDGSTLATTSAAGVVRLWDLGAQPLGGPLPGHRGSAWRIAVLAGMRFATSSEDGTVRIWDVLDPDRACERAAGPHGLEALGAYLGAGEEPLVCVPGA